MCGIAGFVNLDSQPVDQTILDRMTDVLAHRGPDGRGTYIDEYAGLGHRRLSIIDLSASGKQPMCNEDQSLWLTFNGEIYNYRVLRQTLLDKGHQFSSETDSEVILHAYEEWGTDCLQRFNGMFAFAVWDKNRKCLFLARDRLGIKPLFYTLLPGKLLAFASEIKGILAHPQVPHVLNYNALPYYLALNYTPAPYTLSQNICQLLPGEYLTINHESELQKKQYWDIRYEETDSGLSETHYLQELQTYLSNSVNDQLMSDVPFGAFLSGGVDSSSIVYWMTRHLSHAVKTFAVGFSNAGQKSYDESGYARQVAQALDTEHYEQVVDVDLTEVLPRLIWHAEEPTADSSMVGVYLVSQFARRHVTMTLSGDGADEIFAGYDTYQAHYYHRLFRLLPTLLRNKLLPALLAYLPVSTAKVSLDFKLRRFLMSGNYRTEDAHALWRQIFSAEERQKLLQPVWDNLATHADMLDLYRPYFAATNAQHPVNRMLYVDTRFYLPNDMLVKVDRMSMAHGLEVRVPFLDHQLVEFAARVPASLKLRHFRTNKYLLKRAMSQKLPDEVLWRKKAGFNMPKAQWMKGDLRDFMLDHLSSTQIKRMGFLDSTVVQTIINDHLTAKADNSHQLWGLLMLSLWWQRFQPGDSR